MPKLIDRKAKQRQLTQAALELFLKKGYKSVTTREIAANAGISKGVLYHYFKNKEDLFYQTIREHVVQTITIKAALKDSTLSPIERFNKLISICDTSEKQRRMRFQMMFDFLVYCSNKELVNEIIGAIFDDTRAIIKKILTEAFPESLGDSVSVNNFGNIITAYLDGIHFQNIIDPKKARLVETNEFFWKMVREKIHSSAAVQSD